MLELSDALRVVATYRTGSSWPIVVETTDGLRFTKLRGAGQGTGALVAEVIVGTLAEALGLSVPARSLVRLPPDIESIDKNDELRQLLDASVGTNLGFTFLEDATMLDPNAIDRVNPDDAAAILWLDELVLNPDRTRHNPNLVWSHDHLWLIDHGAALNIQYSWPSVTEQSTKTPLVSHEPHLLRDQASNLPEWDAILAARLTRDVIENAVAEVPDDLLAPLLPSDVAPTPDALRRRRAAYVAFLWKRLTPPRDWVGVEQLLAPRKRGRPNWLR